MGGATMDLILIILILLLLFGGGWGYSRYGYGGGIGIGGILLILLVVYLLFGFGSIWLGPKGCSPRPARAWLLAWGAAPGCRRASTAPAPRCPRPRAG